MAQNIDNKQDAKTHLLDKLSVCAAFCGAGKTYICNNTDMLYYELN